MPKIEEIMPKAIPIITAVMALLVFFEIILFLKRYIKIHLRL